MHYIIVVFALGLAMTQIELEKVANTFDQGQSGSINLSEMVAVLKGTSKKQSMPQKVMSDADKIDFEVMVLQWMLYILMFAKIVLQIQQQVSKCTCEHRFKVSRVAEGQYRVRSS